MTQYAILSGARVDAIRKERGFSLDMLASRAGLGLRATTRACRWENPRVLPETAEKLAAALGVDLSELADLVK